MGYRIGSGGSLKFLKFPVVSVNFSFICLTAGRQMENMYNVAAVVVVGAVPLAFRQGPQPGVDKNWAVGQGGIGHDTCSYF